MSFVQRNQNTTPAALTSLRGSGGLPATVIASAFFLIWFSGCELEKESDGINSKTLSEPIVVESMNEYMRRTHSNGKRYNDVLETVNSKETALAAIPKLKLLKKESEQIHAAGQALGANGETKDMNIDESIAQKTEFEIKRGVQEMDRIKNIPDAYEALKAAGISR